MSTMSTMTELDRDHQYNVSLNSSDRVGPHPVSFQASVTGLLLLEMVLGLSSNLTVLVLYCLKQNLVSSMSSIITMNLHVVDTVVCVCCIPLTVAVVLLPLEAETDVIRCFHEAGISFASVATAANVLAITVDRYDASVRPAHRGVTTGRAVALLGIIWAASLMSFLAPFMEVGFFLGTDPKPVNQTSRTSLPHHKDYGPELGLYAHLLAQIPFFFSTAAVMLVTYYKILQAFNTRIGTRFEQHKGPKENRAAAVSSPPSAEVHRSPGNAALGMCASVSVIVALRRAVKLHRERKRRQKRVLGMSLLIISTFLLCWTPITVLNTFILSAGMGDLMVRLRLSFLVMAYGTTVFHPLLYAFARDKFQKAVRSRMTRNADLINKVRLGHSEVRLGHSEVILGHSHSRQDQEPD